MSVLKKNKESHLKKTMFFDEGVDIQRFDVLKYPALDKITEKQLGFFFCFPGGPERPSKK